MYHLVDPKPNKLGYQQIEVQVPTQQKWDRCPYSNKIHYHFSNSETQKKTKTKTTLNTKKISALQSKILVPQ